MNNPEARAERINEKRATYARWGGAVLTAAFISAIPGAVKPEEGPKYDNIVFEDQDNDKIPDMERHLEDTQQVITIEPVVTTYSISPKTESAKIDAEEQPEPVIIQPKLPETKVVEPEAVVEPEVIVEPEVAAAEPVTTPEPEAVAEPVATPEVTMTEPVEATTWGGSVLNSENGNIPGPSGDETYYNLPMDGIVERMHRMGVEGEYWVRDDGVKMLGNYVMVAANLNVHPRGSIVETSLGTGIVCDTGDFAEKHPQRLDIATNW